MAKETDLRSGVHRDTLAIAQNYERTARTRLLRMNMMRSGLEIRAPKGRGQDGGWAAGQGRRQEGFVMERGMDRY